MALENERLSIKNLLFTKAIPNYVIPFPTDGYKLFPCIDCGDKFVFETGYEDHVNRKSIQISYMCRYCSQLMIFHNRCNLLSHIRSHAFKTATINVNDLKIEPLPLNFFNPGRSKRNESTTHQIQMSVTPPKANSSVVCFECKKSISSGSSVLKDRQNHFMKYTNEVHSCPICLFTLPTICGLKAHIRLHLKRPPYYCPECGIHLTRTMNYPYSHDCEGFKMMRATARLKCIIDNCQMIHPNEYKDHIKQKHLKKVFKCPLCIVACFNGNTMERHLKSHGTVTKSCIFYQCELCPGKLILQNHLDTHLKSHVNTIHVFPCWTCGEILKDAAALLIHHIAWHVQSTVMKNMYTTFLNIDEKDSNKSKKIYRVVKKCEKCQRCFTYKCKYNEINDTPNDCPYKCTKDLQMAMGVDRPGVDSSTMQTIKCNLCKRNITQDWKEIKKHFGAYHKSHKCMDAKLVLQRLNYKKHLKQNKHKTSKENVTSMIKKHSKVRRPHNNMVVPVNPESIILAAEDDQYICKKCGYGSETKEVLELHMLAHRDPCMAYQCMECAESFVVKPTFSKHLLLVHNIEDTEQYITTKKCHNPDAFLKTQFNKIQEDNLPLNKNQCSICRDQFGNSEDLEKHFRVHGMAFLLKNTSNKMNTSP